MVQPATARLPSVPPGQAVLPAFTRFCMAAGPILLGVLALLAVAYCIYVWVAQVRAPGILDRVSSDYDVCAGSGVAAQRSRDLHTAGGLP